MENPSKSLYSFDLHIHSLYSYDSWSRPNDILKQALKRNLNCIAITDHDTIKGGVAAKAISNNYNIEVIVGSEVKTDIGDIIGLFLTKEINSNMWLDVIKEIKAQNGLVLFPHPFTGHKLIEEIIPHVDIVEIFNSRDNEERNNKSIALARKHNKAVVVGSDAHFSNHVGLSINEAMGYDIKDAILAKEKKLSVRYAPIYSYHFSQIIKHIHLKNFKSIIKELEYFLRNCFKRKILQIGKPLTSKIKFYS